MMIPGGWMQSSIRSCRPIRPRRTICTMAIEQVFDLGSFLEVHADFAQNAIVGFARLHGQPVGVVAQQPHGHVRRDRHRRLRQDRALRALLRCLQHSADHLLRLARFYARAWPRNTAGSSATGRRLSTPISEATVPKLTVVTRKGYGGAYIVMSSKHIHADLVFAWPTAEIAVMGAEGAVNILFRKEISASADPAAERARLVAEFREKFSNPYRAAASGFVDDVLHPGRNTAALDRCAGTAARQADQPAGQKTRQHAVIDRSAVEVIFELTCPRPGGQHPGDC